MITLQGQFFDGQKPVAIPAKMEIEGQETRLIAAGISRQYALSDLKISPRVGSSDRFIALPGNEQFLCADGTVLDGFPQESPSEGPVGWLENRSEFALAGVVVTACLLLLGYFFGLPAAASRIAERIPMETEQVLGRQALRWFDEQQWFSPSLLNRNRQNEIAEGFKRLCTGSRFKRAYRLEFRGSKLGANAFALPGGIIVITDDMVATAEKTDEVLAVLAHEMGHVEHRHAMRGLLQGSAVALAVATVTADAASLNGVIAGLPLLLANTKYSREFETDADEFAFWLLRQKGYSPNAFASVMERLSKNNQGMEAPFSYLSTHPVTEERIARARKAAY